MSLMVAGLELVAPVRERRAFRRRLERIVQRSGVAQAVSIQFCDDVEIRALNDSYRGIDKSTDVLSFPSDIDFEFEVDALDVIPLGDIAISVDTAARQAKTFGHATADELLILATHGIAHLLGFDHERSADAARAQAEFELMVLDACSIDVTLALCGRAL